MKETLRLEAVLLIIATVSGLILATMDFYVSDIIAKQELETTLVSYRGIFRDQADDFEPYDTTELAKLKERYPTITDILLARKGEDVVGYGINHLAYGYDGAFKNAIGVLNDGTMAGFRGISNSEAPSFGNHISEPEYAESYVGKSIEEPLKGDKDPQADDEIMMMIGATITSKGALEGINKVIDFYHKELVEQEGSMDLEKVLKDGMFKSNPIFIQLVGLCSTLAVTDTLLNSLAMRIAVTFVLIMSNTVVSALCRIIPSKVRIPAFTVVIATFVTLVEMILHTYVPLIYEALDIFLPLIVVNCCILGEAEGFTYQNKIIPLFIDEFGTGLGYTIAVSAMDFVRELLGSEELFGTRTFPEAYPSIGFLVAPAGAFVLLEFLIAAFRYLMGKKKEA